MSMSKVKNEPQVAPHLRIGIRGQSDADSVEVNNGERVLWVNTSGKHCTLRFNESPFEDKSREYRVRAGEYLFSPLIQGQINAVYRYRVDCNEKERPHQGDPVIVIKG